MENLRKFIDILDKDILKLFEKRFGYVINILNIKQCKNIEIFNLKREIDILNRIERYSLKWYKDYNIALFLNILNITKIFEFDRKSYKNINKSKRFVENIKSFSFKNIDIATFNVKHLYIFKKNFINCRFKICKTGYKALEKLYIKDVDFAIININKFYKYIYGFLKNCNIYINKLIKYRCDRYLLLSKKLYFEVGYNIIYLKLKFLNKNNIFLYFSNLLTIKKAKILEAKNLNIHGGYIFIYLKIFMYFKDICSFLRFIDCIKIYAVDVKIFGLFKIKKI